MLSLLVWLAMQLPYNSVDCDPLMRNGKEYQQCAVDAPAEHVIEIKARREMPKGESSCWISKSGVINDDTGLPMCDVTRELWIDGVRWGVVKGLD